jgi:RloB-like protein
MTSRVKKVRSSIPTYAIVGDGYCEKIYFDQLKGVEQLRHISIKPELPQKTGLSRVLEKAEELHEQGYDKVYCIIDYDVVLSNNQTPYFLKQKAKLEKKGIVVLVCNPCFEVWFLLHYKKTGKLYSNCDSVGKDIKSETDLSDYSKEQQYYQKKQIYKFLRPKLNDAVANAQFLELKREDESLNFPRAEIYKLIQELLDL